MKSLLRWFLLCLALAQLGTATAQAPNPAAATAVANYQGIWWNAPAASESGWGINFAHQGDTIFATWFTFGQDGKPLWLVVAANRTAPDVYAGDVYTGTGSPYDRVPFDPGATAPIKVGSATLSFAGADSALLAYTVNGSAQTKSLTRQVFSAPSPTCVWGGPVDAADATNYQDMWWAAPPGSEAGWGINFAHQGDTIFATWFTYGTDGKPLWMVVAATRIAAKVYSGALYTGTGPAFDAVPFDPAKVVATPAGMATLSFVDGNNATFAWTLDGVTRSKAITRQVFAPPGTVCLPPTGLGPSFELSMSPDSLLLVPGETRDVYVTVTPRNGYTGAVALSASDLPAGIEHQFSPATLSVGPAAVSATLRLTASGTAPVTAGSATVTVSGLDGAGGSAPAWLALGVAPALDPVARRLAAVAAVEEHCRELSRQSLSPTAFVQAVAAFMATRPEYRAAGVDLETQSAWGRFTDGRLHLVAANREPAPAASAGTARSVAARKAAELPKATKARLLHSFGPNFEGQGPVDQMRGYLKGKGWTVRAGAEGEAHVGTLKGTIGDGFLYLNTHGGRGEVDDPSEPDGKMYSIQSSTLVDSDYEKLFDADLTALRLVHFTARNGDQIRLLGFPLMSDWDTRYAITYRFVDAYMSFAGESVVLINACYSSRNDAFVKAFLRKGAGVYLGWSELLSAGAAYESAPYFVDRMVGANQHPIKESPPQRAFPYDRVLQDMAKRGLDTDKATGGKLQATAKPGLPHPPIFAPSIRYVTVDEYAETLKLTGEFGADKPKVFVGGVEVAPQSWSAAEIVATLPRTGAGSSGDVVVEVRGVKSNARQLTEWAIPLKYSWINAYDSAGHKFEGAGSVRLRADVAGHRLLPGEAPKYVARGGVATRDSSLPLTASGSYKDGDCTVTLSGSGVYVSPAALGGVPGVILANGFRIAGDTRQAALGLAFGFMDSPHTMTFSGKDCPAGAFPIAPTMGLLDGIVNLPADPSDNPATFPLPGLQFTLDANFGMPATSKPYSDLGGTITVSWAAVPAKAPPRDTDDAGK